MNNIELATNIAKEIVEELFGFIPVFQKNSNTEMYTFEGQEYFNKVHIIVLNHLDNYLEEEQDGFNLFSL